MHDSVTFEQGAWEFLILFLIVFFQHCIILLITIDISQSIVVNALWACGLLTSISFHHANTDLIVDKYRTFKKLPIFQA